MTIPSSPQEGRLRAFELLLVAALVASVAVAVAFWARPTQARSLPVGTTFVVNSTADLEDEALRDSPNACDTGRFVLGSGPECTLRAAIQEANNTTGADRIHFNIPGPGVKTIRPTSKLPTIVTPMTLDGYTQPGASKNTLAKGTNAVLLIELDGAQAGTATGLLIGSTASNSVVRGLVINRFSANGIAIDSDGNKVEDNFLGTDANGTQDLGNGNDGVSVGSSLNNVVGGTTAEARNLISGNNQQGIQFFGTMTDNKIEGNLIGRSDLFNSGQEFGGLQPLSS